MLSWTFAAAALMLVALPPLFPRRMRPLAHAALSAIGLLVIWHVPIVAIVLASAGVWAVGRLLPRCPAPLRGVLLTAAICAVVVVFVWLKAGVRATWGPTAGTVVGLAYFAPKFIQHLLDAAAGRVRQVGPVDFLCCILFLPTYAAGPIERTDTFATQLAQLTPTWDDRVAGTERIVLGLGKKLLLGDPLLTFAMPLFADPASASAGSLLLAIYAYAIGLYLDFAAYSDMAIGAGRAAGLRIRENFDWPYLQPNIGALWQHWHMSLTSWLRDFVFLPVTRRVLRVSGSVLGSQVTGQLVTMTVCGLWHGIAWQFVVWGLYHGVGLAGLAVWRRRRGPAPNDPWRRAVATVATFHFFALGLVPFANDLGASARILGRLLGLE